MRKRWNQPTIHMNIFEEVKRLSLPFGEYIVLGSGILGALGIREIGDVDLLVNPRLFDKLRKQDWKYQEVEFDGRTRQKLTKGNAETYKDFWCGALRFDTMEMIAEAKVIGGVPFLSLSKLREIKKEMNREKDKKDIELIDEYLAYSSSQAVSKLV